MSFISLEGSGRHENKNNIRLSLGKSVSIFELPVLGSLDRSGLEDRDFSSCKNHCKYREVNQVIFGSTLIKLKGE